MEYAPDLSFGKINVVFYTSVIVSPRLINFQVEGNRFKVQYFTRVATQSWVLQIKQDFSFACGIFNFAVVLCVDAIFPLA